MYAAVVHGKEDIRYEQVETPVPGRGQVLVKVKYTGICGSDIPRVNDGACHFFPTILGHEFSGTVASLGEGVDTVEIGDHVAGIPLVPCMKCKDCLDGNYSLCKHYSFVGSRQDGSFAEYVLVPQQNVFKYDKTVSFEQGAFFEPSTVALHGLKVAGYEHGKNVAVVGCGTVGLFALQWIRIKGADQIIAIDISEERLALAKELGADIILNSGEEGFQDMVLEITEGRGFDYVFDVTGNSYSMQQTFSLLGNKGMVCMIGTPKKPMEFSVKQWEYLNRKEMMLTGSWMSYSAPFPGEEWEMTAHYFNTGDLKIMDKMIDRILPLEKIADAFELFKIPGAVNGKIMIDSER